MRPGSGAILIAFLAFSLGGPLLLGLAGAQRGRHGRRAAGGRGPDLRTMVSSGLLYALAFNLVFIVQELGLVVPKALTPGLHPTLFHNNHTWTGDNPIAALWQGCGALLILALGLGAMAWVQRTSCRSATWRLFGLWVAYQGLYQSLPQLVAGAILPQNDVGMAMDYLRLGAPARLACAVFACLAMAAAGVWFSSRFVQLGSGEGREPPGTVLRLAVLPSLLAAPLILIFRVPGSLDQVVLVPVVVTLLGALWMQASAWWLRTVEPGARLARPAVVAPAVALIAVLAVFQLALRPGIAF